MTRYGLVIDQERCIGCDCCTIACKMEHQLEKGFIHVFTQGTNAKDCPIGDFPNLTLTFLPKTCNHCENPPCLEVCPAEAITKREDGIVIIDEKLCTGCQSCMEACPYDVIIFDQVKGIAEKCNLCAHRIDEGLEPFCLVCCEGQAIYFGDLSDEYSIVSKVIRERESFRLKEKLGTGPSVYYLKPKPKRDL